MSAQRYAILMIEDDERQQYLVREYFRMYGVADRFEFTSLSSLAGFKDLQETSGIAHFDLLLFDLWLETRNPEDTLIMIEKTRETGCDKPIIVMSSDTTGINIVKHARGVTDACPVLRAAKMVCDMLHVEVLPRYQTH